MAFWGIEVKAGKPYTHFYDNSRGRLRISQAALGSGKSTNKSSLQINVGNKSPVILCNLIPNVFETCHLELEFEEAEEVLFSVLGQRSVHLSGYYIVSSMHEFDGDETDSHGEDIADTDPSASYNRSDDEDVYESDFIDDDVIEMSPTARCKVINKEIVEYEKPSNGNAKRRRLKKKYQSDSDHSVDGSQGEPVVQHNYSAVLESEDEDCFPISFFGRKITISDSEDDKIIDEDKKMKIDAVSKDSKSTSLPCKETCHPCDTLLTSDIGQENIVKSKKKKKKTDEKPLDVISRAAAAERENVEPDKDPDDKDVGIHKENGVQFGKENEESKRSGVGGGTETDGKEKKKKKKKKGKISETAIEDTNEADNNDKMVQDDKEGGIHKENRVQFEEANDRAGVDGSETDGKEKRKKKKMKKGKISEAAIESINEPDKNNKLDRDDKEGGIHYENGVQFEEANDESKRDGVDGTETDEKENKKKKKMKGKISESAIEGANEADINDKMDADSSPVGIKMEKLSHHSEGAFPSILSAAPQETTGKLKKKSKKRTRHDRGSEAEGEVADVIQTGTRKKEEKNKHDKDISTNQKSIEQGKLEKTKAGFKSLVSSIEEELAMGKPSSKQLLH